MVKGMLSLVLACTNSDVPIHVLISDTLQVHNLTCYSNNSFKVARKLSLERGQSLLQLFTEVSEELGESVRGRIILHRWDEALSISSEFNSALVAQAKENPQIWKQLESYAIKYAHRRVPAGRSIQSKHIEGSLNYMCEELFCCIGELALNGTNHEIIKFDKSFYFSFGGGHEPFFLFNLRQYFPSLNNGNTKEFYLMSVDA